MKKIRICTYTILMVFANSCTSTMQDVSFTIKNTGSSNIFVEYIAIQNNDTINVQILPSESQIIWEETLAERQKTNWYYDYKISINTITNQVGDTINFNPNIASNWVLWISSPHNNYNLYIEDSSF